jgi:hypothetical protein
MKAFAGMGVMAFGLQRWWMVSNSASINRSMAVLTLPMFPQRPEDRGLGSIAGNRSEAVIDRRKRLSHLAVRESILAWRVVRLPTGFLTAPLRSRL